MRSRPNHSVEAKEPGTQQPARQWPATDDERKAAGSLRNVVQMMPAVDTSTERAATTHILRLK